MTATTEQLLNELAEKAKAHEQTLNNIVGNTNEHEQLHCSDCGTRNNTTFRICFGLNLCPECHKERWTQYREDAKLSN